MVDVIFLELMRIIARPDRKYILSGFNLPQEHQNDGHKHLSSVHFTILRLKQAPHHFLIMTHPILLIYFAVFLDHSISLFYLNDLLCVFFASC